MLKLFEAATCVSPILSMLRREPPVCIILHIAQIPFMPRYCRRGGITASKRSGWTHCTTGHSRVCHRRRGLGEACVKQKVGLLALSLGCLLLWFWQTICLFRQWIWAFFTAQTLKSEIWFWGMVSPYFGVVHHPQAMKWKIKAKSLRTGALHKFQTYKARFAAK